MSDATVLHCYARGYAAGTTDRSDGVLHRARNPYKAVKHLRCSRNGLWYIGYADAWGQRARRFGGETATEQVAA